MYSKTRDEKKEPRSIHGKTRTLKSTRSQTDMDLCSEFHQCFKVELLTFHGVLLSMFIGWRVDYRTKWFGYDVEYSDDCISVLYVIIQSIHTNHLAYRGEESE